MSQFVCPVCGENFPYVFWDEGSGYWANCETGDIVIVLDAVLYAVISTGEPYAMNELQPIHGHSDK